MKKILFILFFISTTSFSKEVCVEKKELLGYECVQYEEECTSGAQVMKSTWTARRCEKVCVKKEPQYQIETKCFEEKEEIDEDSL